MRLEFAVVIVIVLLMHSVYWAGVIANEEGETVDRWVSLRKMAFLFPLYTVASSIPTFIVVGLLYWWLYAF